LFSTMLDMKTTLFGLSLFATFCVWRVDSLAFNFGACPAIRGMPNFEPAKYLGPWYEYANTFEIYQIGQSCVRATYTDEGPTQVGVFNEGINTITGNYANIKGNARITNPSDTRAELKVAFDIVPFGQDGNEPNYFVVDTDYTSYSLVYNCSPKLFLKKESLWLLTRQQTPSAAFVKWAYSRMESLGLPVSSLRKTEQNDCAELPPAGKEAFQLSVESFGR